MKSKSSETELFVLCLAVALAAQSTIAVSQEDLSLNRIVPSINEAHTPLQLEIVGKGFTEETLVFIEMNARGKYMRYIPEFSSSTMLHLKLPVGFGLRPKERKIYVENVAGSRSDSLNLTFVRKGTLQPEEVDEVEDEVEPSDPDTNESIPPVIHQLQPSEILVAQPLDLLIVGEGFVEGAKAWIEVNVNAGTVKAPEYQFAEFETEFLADTLLQINLQRGFYSSPKQRQVYLVNPDGAASEKILLTILSNMEN